ncbi:hypothetical protein F383_03011 [Gossypium arboreum]|uniref:Uncharacterized protein n=1 Tax=Gossypium arboreum TaxID=29729 RepID=A0A0B0NDV3_GOSAR|nr:hypothetical protein F383_03011 [Gossypium arboreum]
MGMSHGCVHLAGSKHDLQGRLHARAYSIALTTGWSNHTRACHTGVSLLSPSQFWRLLGILKPI